MPRTARSGTVTTDHDEIRNWVEERGGAPAAVKRKTRGDAGILRIDFPGFTGKNLEHISWDDWFKTFDKSKLAFLHRDRDRFNKLIRRGAEEEGKTSRRGGNGRRTASSRRTESGSAKGGAKSAKRGSTRTSAKRTATKGKKTAKRR